LELEIAGEKGPFNLFSLVLRAGAPERWDLVASAKWFSESRAQDLRYLSDKLKRTLSSAELMKISRIVPMGWRDQFVEELQSKLHQAHDLVELRNLEIAGVDVKRAFIITSQRSGAGRLAS
jgi:hypothetical protein